MITSPDEGVALYFEAEARGRDSALPPLKSGSGARARGAVFYRVLEQRADRRPRQSSACRLNADIRLEQAELMPGLAARLRPAASMHNPEFCQLRGDSRPVVT